MVLVVAVAVLAAAAVVVVWRLRGDDPSRFSAAVALAPKTTERFSWTDWTGVRDELGLDLSVDSSPDEVTELFDRAYDHDLVQMTALDTSGPAIQRSLGFSPASIDWELFAQGRDGAVVLMGLPASYDLGRLRERLRSAGFVEPQRADGVWEGGVDLLERLGGSITPELAALQIDEEHHLLVGSDDADYLAQRTDLARGDEDDAVTEAVAAAGPALSAAAYTGDQACSALAMSEADPADRGRASELIAAAGEVHPIAGFAMAALPGGDVRVAMAFETDDQARTDADARSRLAAGPAPGQGGSFPDRFRLGKVVASGPVLTMELHPQADTFVLSDLSSGPVLFATC